MDIERLKKVLNDSNFPDELKKDEIVRILAKDKDVIPNVLDILKNERESKSELCSDLMVELARAYIYIDTIKEPKSQSKESFNKKFVISEMDKMYLKHKSALNHPVNWIKNKQNV
jgi:hypothetical protein